MNGGIVNPDGISIVGLTTEGGSQEEQSTSHKRFFDSREETHHLFYMFRRESPRSNFRREQSVSLRPHRVGLVGILLPCHIRPVTEHDQEGSERSNDKGERGKVILVWMSRGAVACQWDEYETDAKQHADDGQ